MTLVLCYHAVSPTWPAALSVHPESFDRQIRTVLGKGYEPVTFSEAVSSPRRKSVAITFDDSFASVHARALPILESQGAVATVFVPTGFVGIDGPMAWPGTNQWVGTGHEPELRPMGWGQLGELAEKGWEIGSHTITHPVLTETESALLADEMVGSKESIERELGRPCSTIAYPYGAHDERVLEAALDAGYEAGATLPGRFHRARPIRWPRVGVYHADDSKRFARKISPLIRATRRTPIWSLIGPRGDG